MPNLPYASHENFTDAPIASAGDDFVGPWEPMTSHGVMLHTISDKAHSAFFEFSSNRVDADSSLRVKFVPGEINQPHRLTISRPFVRLRVSNTSGEDMTFLRTGIMFGDFFPLTTFSDGVVPQNSDTLLVRALSEQSAIAEGLYQGRFYVNKFGNNEDIDSGSLPEDMWGGGGLYTGQPVGDPDTIAETLEIFSSDAADTAAGTGARTIIVFGLNNLGELDSETVPMSGLTSVFTTKRFYRCFTSIVLTGGSGGENAGTITVRHSTTTANVFILIQPGWNRSRVGAYTIPINSNGYFRENSQSILGSANAQLNGVFAYRPFGGVYQQLRPWTADTGRGTPDVIEGGLPLEPLSDIVCRGVLSASNNINATTNFDILVVQDL